MSVAPRRKTRRRARRKKAEGLRKDMKSLIPIHCCTCELPFKYAERTQLGKLGTSWWYCELHKDMRPRERADIREHVEQFWTHLWMEAIGRIPHGQALEGLICPWCHNEITRHNWASYRCTCVCHTCHERLNDGVEGTICECPAVGPPVPVTVQWTTTATITAVNATWNLTTNPQAEVALPVHQFQLLGWDEDGLP